MKNNNKYFFIYFYQHDLWFWLGSAAFRTEKWELGVRAYSRCTNIEPDVC